MKTKFYIKCLILLFALTLSFGLQAAQRTDSIDNIKPEELERATERFLDLLGTPRMLSRESAESSIEEAIRDETITFGQVAKMKFDDGFVAYLILDIEENSDVEYSSFESGGGAGDYVTDYLPFGVFQDQTFRAFRNNGGGTMIVSSGFWAVKDCHVVGAMVFSPDGSFVKTGVAISTSKIDEKKAVKGLIKVFRSRE